MAPRIALCGAALALAACLPALPALGGTLFDSMTVAGPFDTRTRPRIAMAAAGSPVLVYSFTADDVTTGWFYVPGEAIILEAIASDLAPTSYPLLALAPWGAPRCAYFKPNGVFVCALREPGGWVEDSSLAGPVFSSYTQQSLAADPVSGEPRVAFTVADGSYWRVEYASRDAGVWSVTDVDADLAAYPVLSLALDGAGRPYVAYASSTTETLFVASRASPGEAFGREVVATRDPAGYFRASVAVDPASGQPRLAFFLWSDWMAVGYAWRDGPSGTWTSQWVDSLLDYPPHPVTLALDAAGNPTIAYTNDVPILARTPDVQRLGSEAPLEGGTTGEVWLARREGGAGSGPFTLEQVPIHDVIAEAGGMTVTSGGYPHLALRTPELSTGNPLRHHRVLHAYYYQDPTDVPPPTAPAGFALAPPAPNPARAGGTLRIAFTSPRADQVRCDLLDLAGRCVAALSARACAEGANALSWNPGPLPPGLYFLRLSADAGPSAVRRLALLR